MESFQDSKQASQKMWVMTSASALGYSQRIARGPSNGGGETVHRDVYSTSAAEHLPPYYEVVWVMRVK